MAGLSDRARKGLAAARGKSEPAAAPTPAPGAAPAADPAALLVSAGVVDRAWYAALAGRSFDSDLDAATHYLDHGRVDGLAIHPLLEPAYLAPSTWREAKTDPAIAYVKGLLRKSPHPLLDAEAYEAEHPTARAHRGKVLGHFLEHVQPGTPFPATTERATAVTTWGEWHASMLEWAAEWAGLARLDEPRVTDTWDEGKDAGFVRQWSRAGKPEVAGTSTVTVVMPVRDRVSEVGRAIDSVVDQTLTTWRLVVVDDGSLDGTLELLQARAADDPRITVVRQDALGVCAARNAGVALADGDYVAFLDSDNVWVPHFLDVATSALQGLHARAGYAAVRVLRKDGDVFRAFDGGREHLLVANHVDMNALVVERSLLDQVGEFDEDLRRWVDHDLVLRLTEHEPLRYLGFVGPVIDESEPRLDRISLSESSAWLYRVLEKALVDWDSVAAAPRTAGRTSVLLPTSSEWESTAECVRSVLGASVGDDLEVVLVDHGSDRVSSALLAGLVAGDPRVTVLRRSRTVSRPLAVDLALAASTGEHVALLAPDVRVRSGWLAKVLDALGDPEVVGVQPLLLHPTGVVKAAGWWFAGGRTLPSPFLAGHPGDDARALEPLHVSAIAGTAAVVRAADLVAAHGLDTRIFDEFADVDLCLRLGAGRHRPFRVVTTTQVTQPKPTAPGPARPARDDAQTFLDRWGTTLPGPDGDLFAELGLRVAALDSSGQRQRGIGAVARPLLVRQPVQVTEGAPCLRWALRIGAHEGPAGDKWGDVHFAEDLARALRRLGQQVVVDRRGAVDRPTSYLDDVTLTIRGYERVVPRPGTVSLLWVISHPDLVTPREICEYDAAFAASTPWSQRMSARAGVLVEPLLQATNPALFHPDRADEPGTPAHDVLFVGIGREHRVAVEESVAQGIGISVYGQRWAGILPERYVAGDYVENKKLGAYYAAAGIVLCDHWVDMAAEGFAANRLFDAVAAGARVVSDRVAGAEGTFGPYVQWFDDGPDLRRIVVDERDSLFLTDAERRTQAVEFGRAHSFDARAATLLERAVPLWSTARARTSYLPT